MGPLSHHRLGQPEQVEAAAGRGAVAKAGGSYLQEAAEQPLLWTLEHQDPSPSAAAPSSLLLRLPIATALGDQDLR